SCRPFRFPPHGGHPARLCQTSSQRKFLCRARRTRPDRARQFHRVAPLGTAPRLGNPGPYSPDRVPPRAREGKPVRRSLRRRHGRALPGPPPTKIRPPRQTLSPLRPVAQGESALWSARRLLAGALRPFLGLLFLYAPLRTLR